MADFKDTEVAATYKPYINDGETKHYITNRENNTNNYWKSFYAANTERFGIPAEPEVVEEIVVPEVIAPKFKKKMGGIVVNFIAIVLFIALAAVSYFAVLKDYTYFFAGAGSKELFQVILDNINGLEGKEIGDIIMTFAVPGTAVLAAVLAIVDFIISIVAMASKKKVDAMGALSVIALAAWLACGVLMFFAANVAQDADSIIAYINPLENTGVIYGYYIGAALLLIATICGFCCYKKRK